MYFDIGANVFVASTVTCGFKARAERSSSSTSPNQAVPVAFPQPPKMQLRERTSLAPLSKTSSTRVQSCVPVTALLRISVPWKLKSAPRLVPGSRVWGLNQPLNRYLENGLAGRTIIQEASAPSVEETRMLFFPE